MAAQALGSLLPGSAAITLPRRNPSRRRKVVHFQSLEMRRQALTIYTPVATVNRCAPAVRANYDVFLNFSGEDTRNSFTDHLYNGLVAAKFSVFRDDRELLGKRIGRGLSRAIENCRTAVIVLSQNYGGSKWCLDELCKILECRYAGKGPVVLPIFYDVDVSDVRDQTGPFGRAFRQLAKRHPSKVEEWERALRAVTKIKGWSSWEVADGHQGQLVKMVVAKVSSTLSPLRKKRRESEYKVFPISSPATKKTLASHLHYGLVREKISVFSDDDQYLIGKDFAGEVVKAMDGCKIFVPIISKDFASSPNCLNNLSLMVQYIKKNGAKILPIFYKVNPSQIQEVWDHFQEDMLQHDVPQYTCQQWQESLDCVRSIGGLVSANIGNGDEGLLVNLAVKEVRALLDLNA